MGKSYSGERHSLSTVMLRMCSCIVCSHGSQPEECIASNYYRVYSGSRAHVEDYGYLQAESEQSRGTFMIQGCVMITALFSADTNWAPYSSFNQFDQYIRTSAGTTWNDSCNTGIIQIIWPKTRLWSANGFICNHKILIHLLLYHKWNAAAFRW